MNLIDPLSVVGIVDPLARVYEKIHDSVEEWNQSAQVSDQISTIAEQVVDVLNAVPGMTQAHGRDFKKSTPHFTLRDGSVLRVFVNPVGVTHVFIGDSEGRMIFGGFVGWIHDASLKKAIEDIRSSFC